MIEWKLHLSLKALRLIWEPKLQIRKVVKMRIVKNGFSFLIRIGCMIGLGFLKQDFQEN